MPPVCAVVWGDWGLGDGGNHAVAPATNDAIEGGAGRSSAEMWV